MVNSELLELKIRQSGKTKTYLSSKIGRTIQNLNLKINNKYDFLSSEVDTLCKELNITKLTEKESIFFAHHVDMKSTRKESNK